MRVVLVGATGAVGAEIRGVLERRSFPVDELVPVASARSAGRRLDFRGEQIEVAALDEAVFAGADVALFDVPDEVSTAWAPIAAERGAIVVDNSAAWRLDPAVPLVVPEVNPRAVDEARRGIIASPNCTTLAMVVVVAALHREAGLERLILASYQAVSGAGKPGIDELWDQMEVAVKEEELVRDGLGRAALEAGSAFSHPIALNFIPQAGSFKADGYTSEELKLCHETRKIMGLSELRVTATCVRVPVIRGHGVAIHAEFSEPLTAAGARRLLRKASGVEVVDEPESYSFPTALEAAGRDACYVGRLRQDPFDARALEMFCATDNLRKGAALNTVQIAELLLDPLTSPRLKGGLDVA